MAVALLLQAGATGCYDYDKADERFDEEIVVSRYSQRVDFEDYATFSIKPEVTKFEEDDGDIETEPLDEALAEALVEKVAENMTSRGYRQVDLDANPDIGITISVLSGSVTSYYSGYWGYYWGYPYWGYYYPYYYSYSYNTGTLIVDAVDLKNAEPASPDGGTPSGGDAGPVLPNRLGVMWTGLVYGVLSESRSENLQDGLAGIDQAFKQSPYFRAERSE